MSHSRPVVRTRLLNCPACGGGLQRVPRLPVDRLPGAPPTLRRFRCTQKSCAWEGLIERVGSPGAELRGGEEDEGDDDSRLSLDMPVVELLPPDEPPAEPQEPSRRPPLPKGRARRRRGSSLHVLGLGVALSAVLLLQSSPPSSPGQPGALGQGLLPGQSHDGEELPAGHPWTLQPAVFTAEAARPAAPGAAASAASQSPLSLRRHCRWGVPGRNPYRGSVEQALAAARVPPAVARMLALKIKARQVTERLVIDNRSIRSAQGGARVYASQGFAMSYGTTMCLGTRVNFAPGHQEAADLYEAADDSGHRTAVMVPDVCGNVSVLSAAEETGGTDALQALRAGAFPGGDAGRFAFLVADGAPQAMPEPGTLPAVLLGLAALLRWGRGRR